MACEETDSFLTKEDAEKECSLEMLVSAYILEVRPRMPMLSHGEIIGALEICNIRKHSDWRCCCTRSFLLECLKRSISRVVVLLE